MILLGWALVWALWSLLRFHALRSDALSYWQDSLAWARPYDVFHVPGYPLLIAAGRAALARGPSVPALGLMQAIALGALVLGAWLVYRLLLEARIDHETAAWGALAYGLWPLVGVTYVALPVADAPALALFLAGTLALCRHRIYVAAVFLSMALVTHKATWPLVALLWAALLLSGDRPSLRRSLAASIVLLLPLGALWAAGSVFHDSPAWLVSSNWAAEISPTGALPVLDWLAHALSSGGVSLVKAVLVVGVAAASAVLAWRSSRAERPYAGFGAAIALAILVLCLSLNRTEIWAAVRFSRVLVLPLGWSVLAVDPTFARGRLPQSNWARRAVRPLVVAVLLASQLAYAWYMARVFVW